MRKAIVVAVFLSLGIALGVVLALNAPTPPKQPAIEWLDTPRSLRSFSLESTTGAFDNQALTRRWTIVQFGFLNCPDLCPTGLAQLATLAKRAAAKPLAQEVAYVFVSVDPARDSLEDVNRYAGHFDPAIRGVTGSEAALMHFAEDLGVRVEVSNRGGDYVVAHSVTFAIIDSQGAFRGRFHPGFDVASLLSSLERRLADPGGSPS